MLGSLTIQNGKIVGAVTRVVINDSTVVIGWRSGEVKTKRQYHSITV
ncbi:MAG: hypothetical protein IKJ07_09240 [Clostridia bacterium]|nr:hypothetical protein [Clostridia bacterium]